MKLLAVCVGGAVGSGARWLLSTWALGTLGAGYPWGTWIVNLCGSFLLGLLAHAFAVTAALSPEWRLLLTTGLCGGFTTYATFNLETLKLLEEGHLGTAALYLGGTLVGCLLLGLAGLVCARMVWPAA